MATVWWWVVKPSETGASSRPKDARLVSTPDSGSEYNTLLSGGTYGNMARYQGPFTSKSAAEQAPPGGGSLGDVIGAGAAAGVGNATGLGNISNPLSGLAAIGDFFSRLTESSTWIRAAKILVGGAILLIGIAHVTGMEGKIGDLARKVPA